MSTLNRLDLETLGSWLVMLKFFPNTVGKVDVPNQTLILGCVMLRFQGEDIIEHMIGKCHVFTF